MTDSEDIDIHIKPSPEQKVETNPHKSKPGHAQSRKEYYEWLAQNIKIDEIASIERDNAFDDVHSCRSGGIRLFYKSVTGQVVGIKDGILLEVGFDTVTPNRPLNISSWAYDRAEATKEIEIINNQAIYIHCYHPGYTLVEKLQTIATKFRQEKETGTERPNLLRHYYDVYCLLSNDEVRSFIGTKEYNDHIQERFPKVDFKIPIKENEAYRLSDPVLRAGYTRRYKNTASLYYKGQPKFEDLLGRIKEFLDRL